MRTAKRCISWGMAMLLLCALLTACAFRRGASSTSQQGGSSAPQQELSELDMIKAQWQQYVVDRTEKICAVGVGTPSVSTLIQPIKEQAVIDEILDVCQTLNTDELVMTEDPAETWDRCDLNVILMMQEPPEARSVYIYVYKSGEAYLQLETVSTNCWVHISSWDIYEKLEKYSTY